MPLIFVTLETSHPLIFWLKDVAEPNIPDISVTKDVLEPQDKGLLKLLNAVALSNMPLIFVTLETTQPLIFWLNTPAPANILLIFVTLETSQLLIFWLNTPALLNI